MISRDEIAGLIDHSLLRPDATHEDIALLCGEALEQGFRCVCVNPHFVQAARDLLRGSNIGVCTVIGFPFGMTLTEAKVYEAISVSHLGATEIDMVINIGAAKSGRWDVVSRDISDVVAATPGLVHKVIIEACYLGRDEKVSAVRAALDAGAEFIKTSTGFGPGGAEADDVRLIREVAGGRAGIKAAGGIRTLARLIEMVEAGATVIGTSSGPSIIGDMKAP